MLLVSTLQAFIEGSSLGEFHVRLQMLLVFHCHVLLMPQIEGKGEDSFPRSLCTLFILRHRLTMKPWHAWSLLLNKPHLKIADISYNPIRFGIKSSL